MERAREEDCQYLKKSGLRTYGFRRKCRSAQSVASAGIQEKQRHIRQVCVMRIKVGASGAHARTRDTVIQNCKHDDLVLGILANL